MGFHKMEAVPNTFPDLFLGYSVLWGCIVCYLVSVFRAQSRNRARLEELEKRLSSREG